MIFVAATFTVVGTGIGSNPSLALLALGALVLLFGVPAQYALGAASIVAIAGAYLFSPNNGPAIYQYIGSAVVIASLSIGFLRSSGGVEKKTRSAIIALATTFIIATLLPTIATESEDPLLFTLRLIIPWVLILVAGRRMTPLDFLFFSRAFILFGILQSLIAFLDWSGTSVPGFGYSLIGEFRLENTLFGESFPRAQGLAGHPIVFSVIIIIGIIMIWRDTGRMAALLRVMAAITLTGALLLSGTRSAALALGVGILFLIVRSGSSFGARLRNFMVLGGLVGVLSLNSGVRAYLGEVVGALTESGSYTHRTGAFESIPPLIDGRSTITSIFGNGYSSEGALFDLGFLQQDGLRVIDNQIVTTFVVSGLVGVMLLLCIVVRSVWVGDIFVKTAVLVMLVMFMSFDFLRWAGPSLTFFLIIGMADNSHFMSSSARRRLFSEEDSVRPTLPADTGKFVPAAAGLRGTRGSTPAQRRVGR